MDAKVGAWWRLAWISRLCPLSPDRISIARSSPTAAPRSMLAFIGAHYARSSALPRPSPVQWTLALLGPDETCRHMRLACGALSRHLSVNSIYRRGTCSVPWVADGAYTVHLEEGEMNGDAYLTRFPVS